MRWRIRRVRVDDLNLLHNVELEGLRAFHI